MGTKLVGDHLSIKTKFLGTICPWGQNWLGTVCPEGPIDWGPICGGPNVRGPYVFGTKCVTAPYFCFHEHTWGVSFDIDIELSECFKLKTVPRLAMYRYWQRFKNYNNIQAMVAEELRQPKGGQWVKNFEFV